MTVLLHFNKLNKKKNQSSLRPPHNIDPFYFHLSRAYLQPIHGHFLFWMSFTCVRVFDGGSCGDVRYVVQLTYFSIFQMLCEQGHQPGSFLIISLLICSCNISR